MKFHFFKQKTLLVEFDQPESTSVNFWTFLEITVRMQKFCEKILEKERFFLLADFWGVDELILFLIIK